MPGHSFDTYWWLHMSDAAMNARRVYEIEESNPSYPPQDPDALAWHRSCAISGIVLAACGLESYANDVFLSPFHQSEGFPFGTAVRAIIKEAWFKIVAPYDRPIEKMGPLQKLNVALELAGKAPLGKGDAVHQNSKLAVELRDAFVHSKTRTRPAFDGPEDLAHDTHARLEKRLRKRPFAKSNYYGRTPQPAVAPGVQFVAPPIFPYGCYDHGCVAWVIASHLAVVRHVEAALNLQVLRPLLSQVRFNTTP